MSNTQVKIFNKMLCQMGGQAAGAANGLQNLNYRILLFLQILIPHCIFAYIESEVEIKGGSEALIVSKTID